MEYKLDRRWLAGFFDGEGTVSISYKVNSNGKAEFKRYVALTNTKVDILNHIQSEFGGVVRQNSISKKDNNFKPCYQWRGSSKVGNQFLYEIQNYLILKKEHCDLWFMFNQTVPEMSLGNFHGGLGVDTEFVQNRMCMVNRLKQLNQRGLNAKVL